MKIGILALQGDVREHHKLLKKLGVETIDVKLPEHLDELQGLIIPGGESTTIGKLMERFKLSKPIQKKYLEGMPIYGTCAGAILLAKDIEDSKQPTLNLMDITIRRNGYGRQLQSFEANIKIDEQLTNHLAFRAVFIRSPVIIGIRNGCSVLAQFQNSPVLVQQDNLLASTFHPELTNDTRIHSYFLKLCRSE